jgi:hypothetical protein
VFLCTVPEYGKRTDKIADGYKISGETVRTPNLPPFVTFAIDDIRQNQVTPAKKSADFMTETALDERKSGRPGGT